MSFVDTIKNALHSLTGRGKTTRTNPGGEEDTGGGTIGPAPTDPKGPLGGTAGPLER